MAKSNAKPTQQTEEVIVSLPASALEALAVPMIGGAHEASSNGMTSDVSHTGKYEPFMCYKKSGWEDQVTIKIVQPKPAE